MKKSDLDSGMMIEDRGGRRGLVMIFKDGSGSIVSLNGDVSDEMWSPLVNYNEDLTATTKKSCDIMKVYPRLINSVSLSRETFGRDPLWTRKETKKMIVHISCDDFDGDIVADIVADASVSLIASQISRFVQEHI